MKTRLVTALLVSLALLAQPAAAQDFDAAFDKFEQQTDRAIDEMDAASAALERKDYGTGCSHLANAYREFGVSIQVADELADIIRRDPSLTAQDREDMLAEMQDLRAVLVASRQETSDGWNDLCASAA